MPRCTIVTQKIWVCEPARPQYKAQRLRRGWGWALLGGIVPLFFFLLLFVCRASTCWGCPGGAAALQIGAADFFFFLSLTH